MPVQFFHRNYSSLFIKFHPKIANLKSSWTVNNRLKIRPLIDLILATTLCFNERSIYTHDVLAVVIQQLVDVNPIPVLFMRTVLQALSFYPKMVGFVMNILQRLITKQVRWLIDFSTRENRYLFVGMETSSNLGRFYKMLSKNSSTFISFTSSIATCTIKRRF